MLKLRIQRMEALVPPPTRTLNVWRDIRGAVFAYAEVVGDEYCMHLPGLARFRFSNRGDEIAADVGSEVNEELVVDAYHRNVLPMALQVRGREVLHASAVRSPTGVVALCGISETGKSTIAFGLNRRGYPLWADDVVVFEMSDSRGLAISLPFNIRLRPSAAALFEVDTTRESTPADNDEVLPGAETSPLVAICALRRTNGASPPVAVRRLSLVESFAVFLEHACCFVPQNEERKRQMIHNYLDLAAGTPVFEICFQAGLENLPDILDAIEEMVGKTIADESSLQYLYPEPNLHKALG